MAGIRAAGLRCHQPGKSVRKDDNRQKQGEGGAHLPHFHRVRSKGPWRYGNWYSTLPNSLSSVSLFHTQLKLNSFLNSMYSMTHFLET